ncbi:MAG TPA: response regulator [Planctomycetota bacterium]|nr:response regulator [Planctomycetota bacterium]HRR81145.1 response regulator [Planctomycetota bacterium]HRT97267.1 response regulator [Planctomycetota bacterium]
MAAILIVEDDRNQRLLLQDELGSQGHSIATAANGHEALDTVARFMPDLVIVDIAMPEMDGLELLGKLLAINNHLPVIIHTAYASYKDNFMSWAADAYVVKRGDLTELTNTIERVLSQHRAAGRSTAASA